MIWQFRPAISPYLGSIMTSTLDFKVVMTPAIVVLMLFMSVVTTLILEAGLVASATAFHLLEIATIFAVLV